MTISRQIALLSWTCLATLILAVIGCKIGIYLNNGSFVTLSCFIAGIPVASFAWMKIIRGIGKDWMSRLLAINFIVMCGLACYINLTWVLWAFNLPVDLGTIQDGLMGSNYWFGPFIIAFAAVSFFGF